MLIAKLSNGALILGLSRENVKRLIDGKPIHVSEKSHGVPLPKEMPSINIVFGETEADIKSDLEAADTCGSITGFRPALVGAS